MDDTGSRVYASINSLQYSDDDFKIPLINEKNLVDKKEDHSRNLQAGDYK
jgi:hypothetical protein